ncbi:MAG TPA: type 4a pilus biogenesis protein PilO [Wenzhouxiangella sp.]|nr:type 4a pilus biogenesis protein PilO [Wenzhouxiangella sp.]
MDLSELRDLDFKNIGSASFGVKALLLVIVAVLILVGGYFYIIKDKRETLANHERTEETLKNEFKTKQQKAANLPAYEKQLAEMEEMLESMLRQLPSRTEMPALLIDISQTALGAGIDNELFEPQNEIMRDFYVEKPIKVRMVGAYHEFGNFVSAVASLSRGVILTMRDISLEPVRDSKNRLKLEGVLTTYRYLDEEEESRLAGGAK